MVRHRQRSLGCSMEIWNRPLSQKTRACADTIWDCSSYGQGPGTTQKSVTCSSISLNNPTLLETGKIEFGQTEMIILGILVNEGEFMIDPPQRFPELRTCLLSHNIKERSKHTLPSRISPPMDSDLTQLKTLTDLLTRGGICVEGTRRKKPRRLTD